ncbi:hypothetical protein BER93_02855 [Xanthomonas fragariae]|nr:hypothetical protein BER92_02850 [Xanthomonas fragariae]AOD17243.1 hypothetical protein BER93_02855 [Xanthomonas fragariae]ENZ96156.1 hypothetical protein O1K_05947 [Xanthomonas fragariae LMG 25863]
MGKIPASKTGQSIAATHVRAASRCRIEATAVHPLAIAGHLQAASIGADALGAQIAVRAHQSQRDRCVARLAPQAKREALGLHGLQTTDLPAHGTTARSARSRDCDYSG